MLRQLFYVSTARETLARADIGDILAQSRLNNGRRDVTGCLLYAGGAFAQVLEGEPETIADLTARIALDPRHTGVRVIVDRNVATRSYATWSMGFVHALGLEDDLRALLQATTPPGDAEAVMRRIRPDTVMGSL